MTDIFSEELSPEFVRNMLKGSYDWNCSYFLVTTASGGFEVVARNNTTQEETVVLENGEFETFCADYDEDTRKPDASAFYFNDNDEQAVDEQGLYDPALEVTPKLFKMNPYVRYILCAMLVVSAVYLIYACTRMDTGSVGQSFQGLLEKVVTAIKGG